MCLVPTGGDIRLNLLFKTASSSIVQLGADPIELSEEECLVTRPNARVIKVEKYISGNVTGRAYQVYCKDDTLNPKITKGGAIIITLYNNFWHQVIPSKKKFWLGLVFSGVHDFDLYNWEGRTVHKEEWSRLYDEQQKQLRIEREALLSSDEPKPITKTDSRTTESSERPDPINVHIQNSPLAPTVDLSVATGVIEHIPQHPRV